MILLWSGALKLDLLHPRPDPLDGRGVLRRLLPVDVEIGHDRHEAPFNKLELGFDLFLFGFSLRSSLHRVLRSGRT